MNEKISQDLEKFANIPNLKNAVTFLVQQDLKKIIFIISRLKFWHKNVLKMVFV